MSPETAERTRPGRPRSEDCDRAILAATLDALVEDGYERLSIEGVASRAGVGKATIYRRWSSKAELVVEAVRTRAGCLAPVVDTGDVRADLVELLRGALETMTSDDGRLLTAFLVERLRHPELATEFDRTFLVERRHQVRGLIDGAIERGELPPDTDAELVTDVGFAVLWHRLTLRQAPLAPDLPERIVRQFLPG